MPLILDNDSEIFTCTQIVLKALHGQCHAKFIQIFGPSDSRLRVGGNLIYDDSKYTCICRSSNQSQYVTAKKPTVRI